MAAGRGNNGLGWPARRSTPRSCRCRCSTATTYVGDANTASAIYYAAGRTANGLGTWNAAQVINCSWGGGSPSTRSPMRSRGPAMRPAAAGRGDVHRRPATDTSSTVSLPGQSVRHVVRRDGGRGQQPARSPLRVQQLRDGSGLRGAEQRLRFAYTVGITTTDRTGALGYNAGDYTNNTVANGFGGTSSASPLAAGVGACCRTTRV